MVLTNPDRDSVFDVTGCNVGGGVGGGVGVRVGGGVGAVVDMIGRRWWAWRFNISGLPTQIRERGERTAENSREQQRTAENSREQQRTAENNREQQRTERKEEVH
jgi:hypothetical protein